MEFAGVIREANKGTAELVVLPFLDDQPRHGANVLTSMLKEAVMIGVAGLALGIAAALALTRFLADLLFGLGARDPLTFSALPLGLRLVAVLAALAPASRAVHVNRLVALRAD